MHRRHQRDGRVCRREGPQQFADRARRFADAAPKPSHVLGHRDMEESCRREPAEIGGVETAPCLPLGAFGLPLSRDFIDVTTQTRPGWTHTDSLRVAHAGVRVSVESAGERTYGFWSEEAHDEVHDGADECHEEDRVVHGDFAAPVFLVTQVEDDDDGRHCPSDRKCRRDDEAPAPPVGVGGADGPREGAALRDRQRSGDGEQHDPGIEPDGHTEQTGGGEERDR